MALNILDLTDQIASHAMRTGYFDRVNQHEPKVAPATGMTAAVWANTIVPVPSSGLASTSALLVFNIRLYTSMLQEPQDAIDPSLLAAVDSLLTEYLGDLDLGGTVRNVDVRGQHGEPVRAQAGYVNQDNKLYRVMTITLPLIVNDVWQEAT